MERTNLFSNSFGISGFLQPMPTSNFPTAKQLASTATNEIAVVEHFNIQGMSSLFEKNLVPDVGDGTALRPDVFNRNLNNFVQKFNDSKDPQIKDFVDNVLKNVAQNKDLLHAYTNLMVGG